MPMKLALGDIVELKKPHPCGSKEFEITRVGMGFRIRCCGCGHEAWIPRVKLERAIRKVVSTAAPEDEEKN